MGLGDWQSSRTSKRFAERTRCEVVSLTAGRCGPSESASHPRGYRRVWSGAAFGEEGGFARGRFGNWPTHREHSSPLVTEHTA